MHLNKILTVPVRDIRLLRVLDLLLPHLDDDAALPILLEEPLRDQTPAPDDCGKESDNNYKLVTIIMSLKYM